MRLGDQYGSVPAYCTSQQNVFQCHLFALPRHPIPTHPPLIPIYFAHLGQILLSQEEVAQRAEVRHGMQEFQGSIPDIGSWEHGQEQIPPTHQTWTQAIHSNAK